MLQMLRSRKLGLSVWLSVSAVLPLVVVGLVPTRAGSAGPPGGLSVHVENFPDVQAVEDVDRPVLQPYVKQGVGQIPQGSSNDQLNFAVPSGKRLVIEHVSVGINGDPSESYSTQIIVRDEDGALVIYDLNPPVPARFIGPNRRFVRSDPIRVYAEPETSVTLIVFRSNIGGSSETWVGSVSGYLVDVD